MKFRNAPPIEVESGPKRLESADIVGVLDCLAYI
jgi:hypothetical protein